MEKDFTTVRFLRFSADDPWECRFQDVIIDLVDDCLVSGIISAGTESDDEWSINVKEGFDSLPNPNYSIFAKVVDTGIYELLDENHNVVFKSEGYVPSLMDYYTRNPGFGDYIELFIDDIDKKHLAHSKKFKTSYNNPDDWEEVKSNHTNLYEKGMKDAFAIILSILTSNDKFKISNAINVINKFMDKE